MAVKKRRVDWGEEDSEEDLFALQTAVECEALGSGQLVQVLASVRRLRARFRTTCPYFVSKTLVYDELVGGGEGATGASTTSTPHGLSATEVDVGLEQLKQKKVLTALYMPGIGDFAIIETDEYREIVRRVSQEREGDNGLQRAIRFFQEEIVGEHHGPTFQIPKSSTMTEHMDMLVKHELLIRMPVGKNAPGIDGFAFKVPGSGRVVRSCLDGRLELVSRIKRKRHSEMLVSKIRKEIKLRKSTLGIEWHIADLVGSGLVHVEETTVGKLLRLVAQD